MRQLPSDKYNVAWFKLAEFVSRGEKERALGLYRLLMHSFDDKALAHQLEGDLLLSFKNDDSIMAYQKAAQLYQEDGRFIQAIAVYERLLQLNPEQESTFYILCDLYELLDMDERSWQKKQEYFIRMITKHSYENYMELFHELLDTCINNTKRKSFFTELKVRNQHAYEYACTYLKNG